MTDATLDPTRDTTAALTSSGTTALTDSFREHFSGDAPLIEKATNFARARPWTSAALVGIAAMAVLNSLRGVRR